MAFSIWLLIVCCIPISCAEDKTVAILKSVLVDEDTSVGNSPKVTSVPDGCDRSILQHRNSSAVIRGLHPSVRLGVAVVIFLAVGFLSAIVAFVFHTVRKVVYHDANNLDTAFDAGGKVSIGLTATTIVSQWTWSATLLQSCTVASKYGISGPYWYAAGATIQVLLFSILSIHLKIRAPGAKTFLQVIRARFGKGTHIVFCAYAAFTNLVVTASLILAACAVLSGLIQGMSQELAVILVTAIIGGYTLIGGLGATFYVSYFNTTVIFIVLLALVVEVYHNPYDRETNIFGSSDKVYEYLACLKSPKGNVEGSYLTFLSKGGFYFGVINIIGNFGTVFCDQSYWQSSVAAKPRQGVWGFILGGLTWFAIPFSLATTMGLAYLGMSSAQRTPLLTPLDVDKGLVAPVVAQVILGKAGEYSIIVLILMAVMSTGSAEVIAVSSLVIYDIFQTYVRPFRKNTAEDECILCLKPYHERIQSPNEEICACPPMPTCASCHQDTLVRMECSRLVKPPFTCTTHGEFREYLERLLNYKNWCILWITLFIIPLHLVCYTSNLNLSWVYLFTGIIISSATIPITMSIMWARVNAKGMVIGSLGGSICSVVCWLAVASTYPGGLSDFLTNTGRELPMLVGNLVSFLSGGLLCFIVTMVTSKSMSTKEITMEWDKTRNIDNPLNPWIQLYKLELQIEEVSTHHSRPPLELVIKTFQGAKIIAYTFGLALTLLFIVIWPGAVISTRVLTSFGFSVWTSISRIWTYIAAAFIIIVPLVQEFLAIKRKIKENKNNPPDQVQGEISTVENGLKLSKMPADGNTSQTRF